MIKSTIKFWIVLIVTFSNVMPINSQEVIENIDELAKQEGSREEIQRYFGYEDLLFRFTTLPYDVSQNTNQSGRFVDIGYLLLSLIPVVILGLSYRKKKLFYGMSCLFLLYLGSCFVYSIIFTPAGVLNAKKLNDVTSNQIDISDKFLSILYKSADFILSPLINAVNSVVNANNSLVYVILFAAFVLPFLFMTRYTSKRSLWVIFGAYLFLWLLLSGGILWYGFLLLPLGLILVFIDFDKQLLHSRPIRTLGLGICVIWVLAATISRISYLDYGSFEREHAGKSMLNGNLFPYAVGLYDERQTLDFTSPYLSKALDKINGDNDYVYMVGTSFSFNIKNNVKRIFQDDLLSSYTWMVNIYEEKDLVISALKASNFGYIVVDLNTPTLDRTPEKSLTQKYRLLLNFLYQNPYVSLISTDRIIEFVDSEGNSQKIANVFGENIISRGSYAIYEIL